MRLSKLVRSTFGRSIAGGSGLWALGSWETPASSSPRAKSPEPRARPEMTNAANCFAALAWPAFRLPTRLAVGFGLDALRAFGSIHPGRWQAVALVPPFLGAED